MVISTYLPYLLFVHEREETCFIVNWGEREREREREGEREKKVKKKKKKKRNLSNWNNSGFYIDSSQSIRDSLLALVPYKISKLVSLFNFRLGSSFSQEEDHTIYWSFLFVKENF